jgi:hypothetical protein
MFECIRPASGVVVEDGAEAAGAAHESNGGGGGMLNVSETTRAATRPTPRDSISLGG